MLSKKICSCCLFICVLIFSSTFVSCKREVEVDLGEDKKNIAEKDTTPTDVVSNVSVTVGNNSVLIEWMNPIDNDFEKVRIRYTPTVNNIPQPIYLKGEAGKKSQICIDNLKNDTEYTFYLVAVDTNNNLSDEIIVKSIPRAPVDKTPPAVITDLTATPEDKSVLLSWKNPSDEDFVKVEVTFELEDQDITQPIYLKGEVGEISSICIENLENNTEYTFYICTIDLHNNISEKVSVKATPFDEIPPKSITYLTATPSDSSVLLSWTNPADEDFENVEIIFEPAAESVVQPIIMAGETGKTTSVCIENLQNGIEYTFYITAIDSNDNKSETVSIESTPKLPVDETPPELITNLVATSEDRSVLLSWTNPTDEDFQMVKILFTPVSESVLQPIYIQGEAGKTSSVCIENLRNNVEYTFSCISIDKNNNQSQAVSIKSIPKDDTPPEDVTNLIATAKHKRVILSWINPSDEDFAAIEISCTPIDGDSVQPIVISGKSLEQRNYTISNLENDTEYSFTVKAIDTSNNISEGRIISSMPIASTIQLNVTLPNDENEITLTNDEAPIDIKILSSDKITKVVWKKNPGNMIVNAEDLLKDIFANQLSNNVSSRFFVSENGVYDIAVQNEEGISVLKQVEVKTIDKIPLSDVKKLSVICDGNRFTINWNNPVADNSYDSPLTNIRISYVYNDTQDNETSILLSDVNTYSINVPSGMSGDDYITIKVQSVDELGNISEGISVSEFCCYVIRGSSYYVAESIKSMTKNGKVILEGDCDCKEINNACKELRKTAIGKNVRIDLDLANITNLIIPDYSFQNNTSLIGVILPDTLQELGSLAFEGCSNLASVKIPYIYHIYGIQGGCFQDCTSLTNVNIGDVLSIGSSAFSGCTALTEINISDYVRRIDSRAFYGCTNLETVNIGARVKTINEGTFKNCDNLTVVNFKFASYEWYKRSGRITESDKKGNLNGSRIGYAFTYSQKNGRLLAETYSDYSLYREDYEPLLRPAY